MKLLMLLHVSVAVHVLLHVRMHQQCFSFLRKFLSLHYCRKEILSAAIA
jgi:hypothetical protein